MKTVPEMLREAAQTYEERNALYGDNYKRFGPIMTALFPDGLTLKGPDDFNRIGIFVQMMAKMTRYGAQWSKGGHDDSALDLSVYANMLRELDSEVREKKPAHITLPRDTHSRDWLSEFNGEMFVGDPAEPADGWIRWFGGENPIDDPQQLVDYMVRDGIKSRAPAGILHWEHSNSKGDILRFKVVQPERRLWVDHDGKRIPDLSPGDVVEYERRGGSRGKAEVRSLLWCWAKTTQMPHDIVRYRGL